jgi:hypothetical protein
MACRVYLVSVHRLPLLLLMRSLLECVDLYCDAHHTKRSEPQGVQEDF